MINLNRKTDYSLQFVTALAHLKKDENLSLKTFAKQSKISFAFLQRIASPLKKAGLIKSEQGSAGGYVLAKKSNQISVQNIVEAIEGPMQVAMCIKNPGACFFEKKCPTKKTISKINNEISKVLQKIKISQL